MVLITHTLTSILGPIPGNPSNSTSLRSEERIDLRILKVPNPLLDQGIILEAGHDVFPCGGKDQHGAAGYVRGLSRARTVLQSGTFRVGIALERVIV